MGLTDLSHSKTVRESCLHFMLGIHALLLQFMLKQDLVMQG